MNVLKPSLARPQLAVAGRLRLIGRDLETGGEVELGGGVFPVEPGETKGTPTLTPCKPAKNGWMIVEVDAEPESG